MANRFLGPDEVIFDMAKIAKEQVSAMSVESVKILADTTTFSAGIAGAILVCLVIAAKNRLEEERYGEN